MHRALVGRDIQRQLDVDVRPSVQRRQIRAHGTRLGERQCWTEHPRAVTKARGKHVGGHDRQRKRHVPSGRTYRTTERKARALLPS